MIKKIEALEKLRPNAKWHWYGEEYSGLVWEDNEQTKPTENEINVKQTELQAEYQDKQYQRDRVNEYPSIQEQLDMQYWDKINGTTIWQDTINAVKTKYPKE